MATQALLDKRSQWGDTDRPNIPTNLTPPHRTQLNAPSATQAIVSYVDTGDPNK